MKLWVHAAVLTFAALLLAGSLPATAASVAPPLGPTTIPFELGRYIVVPVMFEGRPVKAIIDSGEGGITVDSDLAAAVGLKTGGFKLANGLKVSSAKVTIGLGDKTVAYAFATVMSLKPLFPNGPAPAQIVIGRPMMRQFAVEFDFDNHLLRLHPYKTFMPPAGATMAPLTTWRVLANLRVALDGAPPVDAELDTGNPDSVILPDAYATKLGLDASRTARTAGYVGVNAGGQARLVTLNQLQIAGVALTDVPARIVSPGDKVFTSVNIGLGVLKRFHVWIDFNEGKAWLVPGAAFASPFPRQIGLGWRRTDQGLEITSTVAKGVAEGAGLKTGDVVVAVDGVNGADAMLALVAAANAGGGRSLQFSLADGRSLTVGPGEVND